MHVDLNSLIVATDVFAILMLTIIVISVKLEKNKAKRNSAFVCCTVLTICSLFFEVCNYTLEGNIANTSLLYVTNYGTVAVGEGILYFFAKYAYECVNEKWNTKNTLLKIVFVMCGIDVLIQTIGVFSGASFVIKDAYFVANDLYDITFITTAAGLIFIKIFLFKNKKYIGKYLYAVFTLYYVLPVITTIILIINVEWSFLLQGISLSLLIVYIGIEKQEKENLLTDLINKDSLTGLLNRTAWNKKINELNSNTNEIGVVFADLNNLKYANDHFGHLAGDALINTFTDILKICFKKDSIYRIGGDEFVVVIEKDLSEIENSINNFKEKIIENNHIACFGSETGKGTIINELIRKAEAKMYQNKNEYYKTESRNRRRV